MGPARQGFRPVTLLCGCCCWWWLLPVAVSAGRLASWVACESFGTGTLSYGAKLTRAELAPLPTLSGTATHKPIPHIEVVEQSSGSPIYARYAAQRWWGGGRVGDPNALRQTNGKSFEKYSGCRYARSERLWRSSTAKRGRSTAGRVPMRNRSPDTVPIRFDG